MSRERSTDKKAVAAMLRLVKDNHGTAGVLTSNEIHPDIPTIHEVSHREGTRLRSDGEVKHAGFGLFTGKAGGVDFNFDAGGAMRRAEGFSWTPLYADAACQKALGYDLAAVTAALESLLEGEAGE